MLKDQECGQQDEASLRILALPYLQYSFPHILYHSHGRRGVGFAIVHEDRRRQTMLHNPQAQWQLPSPYVLGG